MRSHFDQLITANVNARASAAALPMRLVQRLPTRAPLYEADGVEEGETFGRVQRLCDGPLPVSLLLADLSHRCVRLLSSSRADCLCGRLQLCRSLHLFYFLQLP